MVSIADLFNFLLHIDKFINLLIQAFGPWTYVILFFVIFVETGLIIVPFLPGDSLLFICGALGASRELNIFTLFALFASAAVLGDTMNYWIGRSVGPRVFRNENARLFKKEYLDEAYAFFKRHGGKAIFIARFIPVIRSFAPFVGGIGRMSYRKFIIYNVLGGIFWVGAFLMGGYFFGGTKLVRDNFSLVIYGIILLSILPLVIRALLSRRKSRNQGP